MREIAGSGWSRRTSRWARPAVMLKAWASHIGIRLDSSRSMPAAPWCASSGRSCMPAAGQRSPAIGAARFRGARHLPPHDAAASFLVVETRRRQTELKFQAIAIAADAGNSSHVWPSNVRPARFLFLPPQFTSAFDGIADTAGLATGSTWSRMTQSGHQPSLALDCRSALARSVAILSCTLVCDVKVFASRPLASARHSRCRALPPLNDRRVV